MTDIDPGLAEGLADPPHDSQRLFRGVLEAFSHPGRIVSLRDAPSAANPLSRAATALVLTLVDRDTPLWLGPGLDTRALGDFVRFHTGAPVVADRADALFGVATAATSPLLEGFAIGSDPYPDRSATVIVEVASLSGGPRRSWRGPGIDGHRPVAIAGLPDALWAEWSANRALFPCGVDVVFTAGSDLLALPRSIAVEA